MTATIRPAVASEGRQQRDHLASRLALAGAVLGMLAGLLELTVGASVRDWVGDKQDTTRLGLTTIALSAVALTAAIALRRPRDGGRVAIALALILPGIICFTTVGRLWYLPGALLLAAGALVLTGTRQPEFAATLDERRWLAGLLVACGGYYVFLGATALGFAGGLGILGGVLIWAAARIAARRSRIAAALLLAGALPFAAATWWSGITPLIAVLAIVIGFGVIRRAP